MKFKKPEIVTMFKCSSGPPVETLDLWKQAELASLLSEVQNPGATPIDAVAQFMVDNAERFVQILWIKEKGRPNGARDKKPRAKRTAETAAQNVA